MMVSESAWSASVLISMCVCSAAIGATAPLMDTASVLSSMSSFASKSPRRPWSASASASTVNMSVLSTWSVPSIKSWCASTWTSAFASVAAFTTGILLIEPSMTGKAPSTRSFAWASISETVVTSVFATSSLASGATKSATFKSLLCFSSSFPFPSSAASCTASAAATIFAAAAASKSIRSSSRKKSISLISILSVIPLTCNVIIHHRPTLIGSADYDRRLSAIFLYICYI